MSLSEDTWLVAQGQPQTLSGANAWLHRMRSTVTRIGGLWTTRRRRSNDVQALLALSDRDLWDLGLSRSDIPAIADGTYRRS